MNKEREEEKIRISTNVTELAEKTCEIDELLMPKDKGGTNKFLQEEKLKTVKKESINHPPHYGGDTTYEAIKVIEAWELSFCLGNTVKYISRAGKKDPTKTIEDLEKALWYLTRELCNLKYNQNSDKLND